ncbi:phosphomannomutase/phosphoglucomutase [Basilea psittacipulmonis]|uniref:Phosphoglucomutase n=1 Tax=Basilea psittacipulmonis DSM 24701 TaxID=1072685 RepID=A0A077DH14_9BURK|nr:phosphomannomutase/phosphoglucomutase [Basilea psittacipulmonis]AIL32468.1 phosphoglucomutase [Basilea psittacipulmonis DSM 24701]
MIAQAVFKAYDIRGIVLEQLNPEFAYLLGRVLGQQAKEHQLAEIVIGHDNRISSPQLAQALANGIHDSGTNTLMLGEVPTPLVYFVTYSQHKGACVAITGSHNPTEYNGFKMMMNHVTLHGQDIQALRDAMLKVKTSVVASTKGTSRFYNPCEDYIQRIISDVNVKRPLKIAIDCGNAVSGKVAPVLYRAMGCEVDALFCESDGTFPNHHPDPADPKNLVDLIHHVQHSDAEFGLAFDGDGDRLGVVTKHGEIIWPDRQLILFAQDLIKRHPQAKIIYDVKCTRHLALAVEKLGATAIMSQTGHSLIKAKLAETQAELAGEMSGHIFFKERWYGFDDGLYAGARLLEILSQYPHPSDVLESLPKDISTPELKIQLNEGEAFPIIEALQRYPKFNAEKCIYIDGVRAEYSDGFGLARASNTTPVIVLRFEAETPQALERIQHIFREALQEVAPHIKLPF